jgi:hypothetical protein
MKRYNHATAPQPMTEEPEGYWVTYAECQAELNKQFATYSVFIEQLTIESTQNFIESKDRVTELTAIFDEHKASVVNSYEQYSKNYRRVAWASWTALVCVALVEIYSRLIL